MENIRNGGYVYDTLYRFSCQENGRLFDMKNTMSKAEAASILEDEIYELKEVAEKCSVIMREITEGYFQKHSPSDEEGKMCITLDFNRIRIFASILDGLILDLNNKAEEIDSLSGETEIKTGGNAA